MKFENYLVFFEVGFMGNTLEDSITVWHIAKYFKSTRKTLKIKNQTDNFLKFENYQK